MVTVMAGTYSKARREELAAFLRNRRERVTPGTSLRSRRPSAALYAALQKLDELRLATK